MVGRTELLCCVFLLSSLLAYHNSVKCSNGTDGHSYKLYDMTGKVLILVNTGIGLKWLLLSMFLCLCSFLSKEQGITSLAVCLAYECFIVLKVSQHVTVVSYDHSMHRGMQLDVQSSLQLLRNVCWNPERVSKSQKRFILRALLLTMFAAVIAMSRISLMQGAPKFSR